MSPYNLPAHLTRYVSAPQKNDPSKTYHLLVLKTSVGEVVEFVSSDIAAPLGSYLGPVSLSYEPYQRLTGRADGSVSSVLAFRLLEVVRDSQAAD